MGKGFKQSVEDTLGAIYRDVGNEFAFAVDDIRQKVVEEAWFGRGATPEAVDFYRWLGPQPSTGIEAVTVTEKGDPLGRSGPEVVAVEAMPPEGRPSNLDERLATAEAYARHQAAGPFGTIEMENALSHEWRDFEEWIDREPPPEPIVGSGISLGEEKEEEVEVECVDAELEI